MLSSTTAIGPVYTSQMTNARCFVNPHNMMDFQPSISNPLPFQSTTHGPDVNGHHNTYCYDEHYNYQQPYSCQPFNSNHIVPSPLSECGVANYVPCHSTLCSCLTPRRLDNSYTVPEVRLSTQPSYAMLSRCPCERSAWPNNTSIVSNASKECTYLLNSTPSPPSCGERGAGKLSSAFDTEKKDRKFECCYEGCSKTYSKKSHLVAHIRVHTGECPFVCTYPFEKNVRQNKKMIESIDNFNLPICGARFCRSDQLSRHLRKHFNIRPFCCPICSKSFFRADHCRMHVRTHKIPDVDIWFSPIAVGGTSNGKLRRCRRVVGRQPLVDFTNESCDMFQGHLVDNGGAGIAASIDKSAYRYSTISKCGEVDDKAFCDSVLRENLCNDNNDLFKYC